MRYQDDTTFDRLDIKKFGKGQIKYVGSGIEADFREYPACLDKDSIITLFDGKETTIANISVGDVVSCIDSELNLTHDVVTRKLNTGVKPVFLITTKSGKTVRATINHEFFTSIGWKRLHELVIEGASNKFPDGTVEPSREVCNASFIGDSFGGRVHRHEEQKQKSLCDYYTWRKAEGLFRVQKKFNANTFHSKNMLFSCRGGRDKRQKSDANNPILVRVKGNTTTSVTREFSLDRSKNPKMQTDNNKGSIGFYGFCWPCLFDSGRWLSKTEWFENINSFTLHKFSTMSNAVVRQLWHPFVDSTRRIFNYLWGNEEFKYRQKWSGTDCRKDKRALYSESALQTGLLFCSPTSFGYSERIPQGLLKTSPCFESKKDIGQNQSCKESVQETQHNIRGGSSFRPTENTTQYSSHAGQPRKNLRIEEDFSFYSDKGEFDSVISIVFDGFSECYDIETEKHHNFFANGLVSHNSSIFVDELNDCNWSNVRFGFSRMDGNIYKFKRFVSNSKTKEHPAEQLLQESTNQDWQVPCVGCGKRHRLDWFETVVNPIEDSEGNVVDYTLKDREWRPGCGRDIVCVCPECGGALDRLSTGGLWVPKNPEAKMEGFHIPSLCSSIASVSELWREFQMGINNPHEMQLFFTRRLAVPFSAVGSKVTGSVMDKCKGTYNMILRPDRAFIAGDSCEGPCTMGVDVGSEKLDVRISKMLAGNKRQAVFIGKIDTKNIEELNDLIERYHVEKVVIDIQPEQALVTQFQETCEADVWLVKLGRKDQTKLENMNYQRKIISYDRTEILDRTYAQLQSGKNIIPENYADIFGGNYVSEMSSPIREMHLDKDGNPIFIWESDGKDHQRFADAYDYLAMRLLNEDGSYITSDCIYDFTKSV
jgi:hypothetical protein